MVWNHLGADAVFLLADHGSIIRPVRASSGSADICLWAGDRLHHHGLGPEPDMAVRWPNSSWDHRSEFLHGKCLHRRRNTAGEAFGSLRNLWRDLWAGFYSRAGTRRVPWRHRPTIAILGVGRTDIAQCMLRPSVPSGVPSQGAPQAVSLVPRQSARIVDAAQIGSGAFTHGDQFIHLPIGSFGL